MTGPSTINGKGSGERPAASALVWGFLCGDPECFKAPDGRRYAEAIVSTPGHHGVISWRLLALADGPREELASLKHGDSVAATGKVYRDPFRGELGNCCILLIDSLISVPQPPFDNGAVA
jgi:hypothetical protein